MKNLLFVCCLLLSGLVTAAPREVCVVTLQIKQVHYTLDLWEHAKDAMNAVEFDVPVDCEYYNSLRIGQKLSNSFRMGSLIIRGSFGDWNVKVVNKKRVNI